MKTATLSLLSGCTLIKSGAGFIPTPPPVNIELVHNSENHLRRFADSFQPPSALPFSRLSSDNKRDMKMASLIPGPLKKHESAKPVFNMSPLFGIDGPRPEDIVQSREINDCYLLSLLASIAHHKPEIVMNALEPADGSGCAYLVNFFKYDNADKTNLLVYDTSYVDESNHPIYAGDPVGREPADRVSWVKVMENWYAKANELYRLTSSKPGFSGIAYSGFAGMPYKLLTGRDMDIVFLDDFDKYQALLGKIEEGAIGVIISKTTTFSKEAFPPLHAYAVLGVEGDQVHLYDPYGHHLRMDSQKLFENSSNLIIDLN